MDDRFRILAGHACSALQFAICNPFNFEDPGDTTYILYYDRLAQSLFILDKISSYILGSFFGGACTHTDDELSGSTCIYDYHIRSEEMLVAMHWVCVRL